MMKDSLYNAQNIPCFQPAWLISHLQMEAECHFEKSENVYNTSRSNILKLGWFNYILIKNAASKTVFIASNDIIVY